MLKDAQCTQHMHKGHHQIITMYKFNHCIHTLSVNVSFQQTMYPTLAMYSGIFVIIIPNENRYILIHRSLIII